MLFNYQEFLDGIDRKAYHEGEWQWRTGKASLRTARRCAAENFPCVGALLW